MIKVIKQSHAGMIKHLKSGVDDEEEEEEPGEERNEFVTVSRKSILNSVSDTGNSNILSLRRHSDDHSVVLLDCRTDQKLD